MKRRMLSIALALLLTISLSGCDTGCKHEIAEWSKVDDQTMSGTCEVCGNEVSKELDWDIIGCEHEVAEWSKVNDQTMSGTCEVCGNEVSKELDWSIISRQRFIGNWFMYQAYFLNDDGTIDHDYSYTRSAAAFMSFNADGTLSGRLLSFGTLEGTWELIDSEDLDSDGDPDIYFRLNMGGGEFHTLIDPERDEFSLKIFDDISQVYDKEKEENRNKVVGTWESSWTYEGRDIRNTITIFRDGTWKDVTYSNGEESEHSEGIWMTTGDNVYLGEGTLYSPCREFEFSNGAMINGEHTFLPK